MTHPASAEQFAVIIARLFNFARTFGLNGVDAKAAVEFYHDALSHLAAPTLAEAVQATISSWRYPRLPNPADVLANVPESWLDGIEARRRVEAELADRDRLARLDRRRHPTAESDTNVDREIQRIRAGLPGMPSVESYVGVSLHHLTAEQHQAHEWRMAEHRKLLDAGEGFRRMPGSKPRAREMA